MTYNELLNELKKLENPKQQIDSLFAFMLNLVDYDYPTLEICNFDYDLSSYIDKNYNPQVESDRLAAIQLVIDCCYSEGFINRILEHYGEKVFVPARPEYFAFGRIQKAIPEHYVYKNFEDARNMAKIQEEYHDGILTKGVCASYSEFVKQVCDDLGISCKKIEGTTSPKVSHVWNLIDTGDGFRHFDLTYAIFSRDGFKNWGSVNPFSWYNLSTEELLKLHPERKISDSQAKLTGLGQQ